MDIRTEPLWTKLGSKQSLILAIIVILAVVALTFCRVPMFDFVAWDDQIHVYENPHFRDFDIREIGYFWLHPYEQLYIPLSYTLFALISIVAHRTTGFQNLTNTGAHLNPHVFHAVSIVLHLANVLLVFVLLRRLTRKDLPAAIGAVLFGIHPLQVESVAWISEIRGLLAGLFSLAAINLYLSYVSLKFAQRNVPSRVAYSVAVLMLCCAMLSKPSAAMIGLIIAAFAVWGCERNWKTAIVEALPFLIVGGILLGITGRVQEPPPGQVVSVWARPLIVGDALFFYVSKFLVPINLAVDYGRQPHRILAHWWIYIEWIVPVSLAAAAFVLRRRASYFAFGLIVSFAALLPVLGFVPFVYQAFSTTADRYMYLAMLGPSIIAAYTLAVIKPDKRTGAELLVSLWLLGLGILSFDQTLVWRSTEPLYAHAVAVNPDSAGAQNGLGKALEARGQYSMSVAHYLRAVAIDPTSGIYETNLGLGYAFLNDDNDAETSLRHAIALDPTYADAHCDLGIVLMGDGNTQDGVAELRTSLQLAPTEYTAAECLGEYYAGKRDFNSAALIFASGAHWMPHIQLLWRDLGMSLIELKRYNDAVQPLTTAIQLDPADKSASDALNYVRSKQQAGQ